VAALQVGTRLLDRHAHSCRAVLLAAGSRTYVLSFPCSTSTAVTFKRRTVQGAAGAGW
jgi:hypothetical protein